MDGKLLLNLDRQRFKNVKVVKVPGIEKYEINPGNEVYGIKYYFMGGDNPNKPKLIRFSAKDPKFDMPFTMDLFNYKYRPVVSFAIKASWSEGEFIQFLDELMIKSKFYKKKFYKDIFEAEHSSSIEEYFNNKEVNEGFFDYIDPASAIYLGYGITVLSIMAGITIKKKWEAWSSNKKEQQLNDQLFGNQAEDNSDFEEYRTLIGHIKQVLKGRLKGTIICGRPGTSKTHIVRRTLYFAGMKAGKDYNIFKGSGNTITDVYYMLYKNRKNILVMDDFDTLLNNEEMVNMLKAITDSYAKRFISMPIEQKFSAPHAGGDVGFVPEKFEYTGRCIIITNLEKKDINKALISRMPTYEVKFDSKQLLELVTKMLKYIRPNVPMQIKQEVYDYIMELYELDPSITVDFRSIEASIEARIGMPGYWKEMAKDAVGFER